MIDPHEVEKLKDTLNTVWVIYKHPSDYPDKVTASAARQRPLDRQLPRHPAPHHPVRLLPPSHPTPSDDPSILESWLE